MGRPGLHDHRRGAGAGQLSRLPSDAQLAELFESLRRSHFPGGLPDAVVEWSSRMRRSAGLCYPRRRLIRLSTHYLRRHPSDLVPVLLHEMIHLVHPRHDRPFKTEAHRVGALLHARAPEGDEPSPPWRWLALCPRCGSGSPYRLRARLVCGRCRDVLGRRPRLEFHPLPGAPSTADQLEQAIAALGDRRGRRAERLRRRISRRARPSRALDAAP